MKTKTRHFNKFFSFLLAMLLVVGMLPTTVFAANGVEITKVGSVSVDADADIVNCGNAFVGEPFYLKLEASGADNLVWSTTNGYGGFSGTGLSLNTATGEITGTPTDKFMGVYSIFVSDANDNTRKDSIQLSINGVDRSETPQITTTTLPNAKVGESYSASIEFTGDNRVVEHSISGKMPDGLSVSKGTTALSISGTPTTAGTYTFSVTITNLVGSTTKDFSITVSDSAVKPTITTNSLPYAVSGKPYSMQLQATGTAPITWGVQDGDALPAGLSLDTTTGIISGTPTGTDGQVSFIITATNETRVEAKKYMYIHVYSAPDITTTTLPNGKINEHYNSQTISTDRADSLTVKSGALPTGMELTYYDVNWSSISGTPTEAGTFYFTLEASRKVGDEVVATTTQDYTLVIDGSGSVTPPESKEISSVAVTVKEPKANDSVSAPTITTENTSIQSYEWLEGENWGIEKFEAGKTYRLKVVIDAKNEYSFKNTDPKTEVTFNGKAATGYDTLDALRLICYYDFAVTGESIPTEYTIKVNSGKATIGAGSEIDKAKENDVITITADAAPEGKEFDKWTVVSGNVTLADATAESTTFTMPGEAVEVTATYKDKTVTPPSPTEYTIKVNSGKATIGAGSEIDKAKENDVITITANAAPEGKEFDKWEVVSGTVTLADANAKETTFTMPGEAVEVTATYKDKAVTPPESKEISSVAVTVKEPKANDSVSAPTITTANTSIQSYEWLEGENWGIEKFEAGKTYRLKVVIDAENEYSFKNTDPKTEVTFNGKAATGYDTLDALRLICYYDFAVTGESIPTEYTIKVNSGKATIGAGSEIDKAKENDVITITADAAPEGKEFDKWEVVSGTVTLADATAESTTFTMPGEAVEITATYKDKETTPTDPTKPGDDTDPSDPTKPGDDTKPTDPTKPGDDTKPTEPTKPSDDTKPAEPTKPSDSKPADTTKTTENKTNSPKTGDNSNMMLWFSLLVLSSAGLTTGAVVRKKKRSAK